MGRLYLVVVRNHDDGVDDLSSFCYSIFLDKEYISFFFLIHYHF